ncbi:hybrid sensor histidine kinase/response regulator [Myxococcus sp. RHSTA-1-4]|uniref:hybrid sensor histidine kinase/response regulator n=1 Tax=Myxococcus sp. RHSTA-1-4 TaxID=2874601 RepID=UPI001CBAB834|nr:hybrid sensor histidine kinase/response regulator [Myxococcus sp. RHSTA-1-4]MBZ4415556.1 response regulator [Myxococcus sp. RHSTA-1-4]
MGDHQGARQEPSGEAKDSRTLLERLQRSEEALERLCSAGAPGVAEGAHAALRQEVSALRQMRGELKLLLERGELIAETAHRLLNLPPDEMESGIRAALALLGAHVRAQRCYVGLLSDDGTRLVDAYEWCAPGTEPLGLEATRGRSLEAFAWTLKEFQAGRTVTVTDPSKLPPEAAAEHRLAAARRVQAYVNTPLSLGGRLAGWMGFDAVGEARSWTPEELHLLGLTGSALVTALERKRRDTALLHEKEQEQRARSLGIIAAGLAHEINNPLAYTTGNLEYLKQRLPCPQVPAGLEDECHQVLDEALEGAVRIRRIVADLGAFSLQDSEELEAVDLVAVINTTLRMAANQLRHRAQVVREQDGDVPKVRGTRTKLGQVLLNLVLNAAQAIPEGRYSENRITLRVRTSDEGVVLALSDTGRGIPPEVLPRIFDPFFTTRRGSGGTGMGLAICRDIITGLGGKIAVRSEPGQGTTVEVHLLRAEQAEPEPPPQKLAPPSRGKRVLAVDDEPRVLDMLKRLLRGHELVTAGNGREALERLRADTTFDVILCDLMMPELTGVDVYHAVRESWPGLHERIVFITGGAFTPETQRFLQQVGNPVLTKPFEPAHLRELVTSISARLPN